MVGELDLGKRGAADGDGGVDVVGADLAVEVLDRVHLDGGRGGGGFLDAHAELACGGDDG